MKSSTLFFGLLFFAMMAGNAFGQNIEDVMDRDPFDPNRGQKETAEVGEEEEVLPEKVGDYKFVLDGTILAGASKMAIITYIPQSPEALAEFRKELNPESDKEDDKSARNNRDNRNNKNNRARGRARKPTAAPTSKAAVVKLNGTLKGYTLSEIDRHKVVLSRGAEKIDLALYSGEKSSRGGTKSIPKPKPQPKALPNKNAAGPKSAITNNNAKAKNNKPKNGIQPKASPRKQRANNARPNNKVQDLKRRF